MVNINIGAQTGPYPSFMPTAYAMENDLRRFEKDFDLNSDVERGTFMQRMLQHWRSESFGVLRDAAGSFDIEIAPHTLHDELIKKIVGRWIKAVLDYRTRPKFQPGDQVRFKRTPNANVEVRVLSLGTTATEEKAFIEVTETQWISVSEIEKVED